MRANNAPESEHIVASTPEKPLTEFWKCYYSSLRSNPDPLHGRTRSSGKCVGVLRGGSKINLQYPFLRSHSFPWQYPHERGRWLMGKFECCKTMILPFDYNQKNACGRLFFRIDRHEPHRWCFPEQPFSTSHPYKLNDEDDEDENEAAIVVGMVLRREKSPLIA